MPSTQFVGLKQRINDYARVFISDKDDLDATPDDHVKAVAFRILASAAIEQFIEERCKTVARVGIERLKKGLPTTTGRALIVWGVSRKNPGCIPVHEVDIDDHRDIFETVLASYLSSVNNTHGTNSKDVRGLLNPVGLRTHHLPSDLLDRLQVLAERRDPVVHTVATKATGRLGPSVERKQIEDIVNLLACVDEALDEALESFPLVQASTHTQS